MKTPGNKSKILLGLCGGGLLLGFGLAALMELAFDRTLKRPMDLESLNIPRMLTIPDFAESQERQDAALNLLAGAPSEPDKFPWEYRMRPYGEALRDRLMLQFHLKHMGTQAKLVALTGSSEGAGASTIACSLASSLAKASKVLLVDMGGNSKSSQPNGTLSLAEVLETENLPSLSLASAHSSELGSTQINPNRFYELIPSLRESGFDFIVFDLPPMGPTSSTLALAAFMDKVLLVIEAEVARRECVRTEFADLVAARADVSAVFNKSRSYGPKNLRTSA